MPRRIIHSKLTEWERVYGKDGTVELVAQAYMKGTRGPIDYKEALAFAKVYVEAIKRVADGDIINLGRLAARNIDEVVKFLKDAKVDAKDIRVAEEILKNKHFQNLLKISQMKKTNINNLLESFKQRN